MHILVILSMILLPVSFSVHASEIPADKNVIVFPGKIGDVTFKHKLHSGLENVGGVEKVECSTCHHTQQGEEPVKVCSNCHVHNKKNAPAGVPDLKKAFHYRCRSCHQYTMEQGKNAGPAKKCKLCHVKSKN